MNWRRRFNFGSTIFAIFQVQTTVRGIAEFSWDDSVRLPVLQLILLIVVLASGMVNVAVVHVRLPISLPQKSTWIYLFAGEIIRVTLLLVAIFLVPIPRSATGAYFATIKSTIFGLLAIGCRCIESLGYGCNQTDRSNLSVEERLILMVIMWNFFIMLVGSIGWKYTEGISFAEAWYFTNMTALTIGYGNLIIQTTAGKVLLLTYGNILVVSTTYFIVSMERIIHISDSHMKRTALLLLAVLTIYTVCGAVIFMELEQWSFLDSLYFAWSTFTTIGYGDFFPRRVISWEFWLLYIYVACSIYAVALRLILKYLSIMRPPNVE
jgi:hypothetical protein